MSESSDPKVRGPSTKSRGDAAEAAAARLLLDAGYELVARNVEAGGVELDIVARDPCESPALFVFVEVRSRASARLGHPLETIDARKRKRLIRGATAWLMQAGLWEKVAVRFDVIAVLRDYSIGVEQVDVPLQASEFEWLRGAFEADG